MLQSEAEVSRTGGSRTGESRFGETRSGGRDRDRRPDRGGDRFDRSGDRGFSRDRDDRGDRDYNRGGDGGGNKRENDIRRRMTAIATYRNNIEFFARSKNADQLRADIDRKIADAEKQLDELKHQLKVAQA